MLGVLVFYMKLECLCAWHASRNGVPGVHHKNDETNVLVVPKIDKCFLDVFDHGALVKYGL